MKRPAYHLLLILLCIVTALGVAGWVVYLRQAHAFLGSVENQLETVADLKQHQIDRWRSERLGDASVILNTLLIRASCVAALDESNTDAQQQTIDFLTAFCRFNGFARVAVLDSQLNCRMAVPGWNTAVGPLAQAYAKRALTSNQILISDLHLSQISGKVNMDYLVPVIPPGDREAQAVLMLEVDPNEFLFPMIQSWPTRSETAETLLVRREGDQVVFLNNLRHRTNSALQLQMPLNQNTNLPAAQAVLGKEGILYGVDYRGVEVMAAVRPIANSPWFMVAKKDVAEIRQPLRRQAWIIGAFTCVLILTAALGTGYLWRSREYQFVQQEVTERRAAEALLRAEKDRYQVLFNEMIAGFALQEVVCDAQGQPCDFRTLHANPAFERLTGLKVEAIKNRPLTEVVPGVDRALLERLGQVALTGKPVQFEDFYFHQSRFFELRAFCPEPGKVAVLLHDVSARKLAEAKLRQYADIVQTMQLGLYVYHLEDLHDDRSLRLVTTNPIGTAVVHLPPEDMLGKTIDELFPNLRATGLPARYAEVVRSGKPVAFDDFAYADDHVLKAVFSVKAFPLPNQCVGVLFDDITTRKRGEMERERLAKELAEKNRELESLIYAASHDLRSPLVNIEGFGRRLEKHCDDIGKLAAIASLPADQQAQLHSLVHQQVPKALSYIRASATKMSALLGGLLQISRLGRATLQLQVLDMNALCDKVLQSAAFQLQKSAAAVRQEALPTCVGDPILIGQVFSNLVDNAVKYRDAQRPLELRLSGSSQAGESIYCVEDTGIGIAPQHQKVVWELFHRLDPSGTVPGEGLGLALVLRIVIRHRGRAWVESTPGKGSRFYVALPNQFPDQQVFDQNPNYRHIVP